MPSASCWRLVKVARFRGRDFQCPALMGEADLRRSRRPAGAASARAPSCRRALSNKRVTLVVRWKFPNTNKPLGGRETCATPWSSPATRTGTGPTTSRWTIRSCFNGGRLRTGVRVHHVDRRRIGLHDGPGDGLEPAAEVLKPQPRVRDYEGHQGRARRRLPRWSTARRRAAGTPRSRSGTGRQGCGG